MTYHTHPQTRIGHVHLKVSDLERAITFYSEVLGFSVQQRIGRQAAFLGAGGYHHHIGLNSWDSAGGPRRRPAPPGCITWPFCIRTAPALAPH